MDPVWIDGRLIDASEIGSTSRTHDRPGCQTTARVADGHAIFLHRHVARLMRDATALGLPVPDEERIEEAFRISGQAAFGSQEGIVRLKASMDPNGALELVATPRPWVEGPACWSALTAPFPHPGPGDAPGAKLTRRPVWDRARALAADRGSDEVLLFDDDERLVEGARTNLLISSAAGEPAFPDPALGAVRGIALAVLTDRMDGLSARRISRHSLREARELIAVNAVRGVRPIVDLDGHPIGDGRPGPLARQLARMFATAIQEESRSAR